MQFSPAVRAVLLNRQLVRVGATEVMSFTAGA